MKKYNLLKISLISIAVIFLLTWFIPNGMFDGTAITVGETGKQGIWQLLGYPRDALGYFGNFLLFFALVGAFYGILNKTKEYKSFLDGIVKMFKGKENIFLISVMVIVGIITSLTGLTYEMFVFFPLIVSVTLLMKYDKMVALASFVGAILIGVMGSTYGYVGAGAINSILGLGYSSQIITKMVLLFVPLALLILSTLTYAKKVKKDAKNSLAKDNNDPLLLSSAKKTGKGKTLLMTITFGILALLMILGFTSWTEAFKVEIFTDFHTWLTGVPIISEFLGTFSAFGEWWIDDLSIILALFIIILPMCYKMKFNVTLDGIFEGIKKMLPVMGMILVINIIFVIIYVNQYNLTIMNALLNDSYNIFNNILNSIVQSVTLIQLPYAAGFTMPALASIVTDGTVHGQIALIFQAMYGLVMFIAPTSLILFIGLAYTEVSYAKWVKFIAKLLLQIALVVIASIIIMSIV